MVFEPYKNQKVEYTRKKREDIPPYVTLQGTGLTRINTTAVETYSLQDYKYVSLYYNEEARTIGMKFHKRKNNKFSKKLLMKDGALLFSMIGFRKHYGIQTQPSTKYHIDYAEKTQMYLINLEEGI
jgi:hypothetical protein